MNNLSQSCYNVYVNKVNREKRVSAFGKNPSSNRILIEINFYFAVCGLPIMLMITTYTGELWLIFE